MDITRRRFLNNACLGAAVLGLGESTAKGDAKPIQGFEVNQGDTKEPSMKNPNILWIHMDDMRPDSLGCYGSNWAKTPNIDSLARHGVVMKNCVCQSPVCVPSRTSQLTCLYPQECNTLLNETADVKVDNVLPEGTISFPQAFAQAGYETFNFGKLHAPEHPYWQNVQYSRRPYGINPNYATVTDLGPGYDEKEYHVIKPSAHGVILGGTYPVFSGNPAMELSDRAIEFIGARKSEKPFLLGINYEWPHTPVLPPPPFDRLYHPDEIPIKYPDERVWKERANYDRDLADLRWLSELPRDQYRQMWKDYMGQEKP